MSLSVLFQEIIFDHFLNSRENDMFILNHSPNKYSEIKNCLSFKKRSSTHQIHSLHILTKVLQVLRRPRQTDAPYRREIGAEGHFTADSSPTFSTATRLCNET